MTHPKFVAIVMALALTGATLQASEKKAGEELAPQASIPFVNIKSSIRDWQADGDLGLWVQDAHKQWYYAKMIAPCHGLDFAVSIGFRTRVSDKLDRFSEVIVPDYDRCGIQSFTKSEAPPEGSRKKGKDADSGG